VIGFTFWNGGGRGKEEKKKKGECPAFSQTGHLRQEKGKANRGPAKEKEQERRGGCVLLLNHYIKEEEETNLAPLNTPEERTKEGGRGKKKN